RAAPALHDREPRLLLDLVHEADAPRAHDAAIAVEEHVTAEVVPSEHALGLAAPSVVRALGVDVVLEVTLAGPVADRTVQRMVHQVELEHGPAVVERALRLRAYHLPFRDRGDTGRHGLRRALHLHQAQP